MKLTSHVVMSLTAEAGVEKPKLLCKCLEHLSTHSVEVSGIHRSHVAPAPLSAYVIPVWPTHFGKFLVAYQQHFHMSLTKSLKFSTFLHCLQTCFCRVHTKTCQRSYGHLSSPQSRRSCEKRHPSVGPVMTAFPGLPGDELAVPVKLKRNSGAAPIQWLTMLYETPGRSHMRVIKGGAMFHCSVIPPGH